MNALLVSHPCETLGVQLQASLPCLPLPLHRTSPSPQPLQKNNNPSPRTKFLPYERSVGFASLRNSGRSTSGIHARPLSKVRCCRPKKFGRLPEGLLYTHQPLHPHNLLKSTSIASPRTIPSNSSPFNFSLFIIQYSFHPCIPLTTSADNSIIKAVTSISI